MFYRELSIKCTNELENLWDEKKRRDKTRLKRANSITSISFVLLIVGLILLGIGLIPLEILAIPVIGIIYGISTTPNSNVDNEYWNERIRIIGRYLNAWQKSPLYCNLPFEYIQGFREISIEFWADLSGMRFNPSHRLH